MEERPVLHRPLWWLGTVILGPGFGMLTAGRGWLALPFLLEPVVFLAVAVVLVLPLARDVPLAEISASPATNWGTFFAILALSAVLVMVAHTVILLPLAWIERMRRPGRSRWYSSPWRAFALAWILPIFLVATPLFTAFRVVRSHDETMRPGIVRSEFVLTRNLYCGSGLDLLGCGLKRGDVVAFRDRDLRRTRFSRIVALAGEAAAVHDGALVLDGTVVPRVEIEKKVHFYYCVDDCSRARQTQTTFAEQWPDGSRVLTVNRQTRTDRLSAPSVTVPAGHVALLDDYRNAAWHEDAAPVIVILPVEEVLSRAMVTLFKLG